MTSRAKVLAVASAGVLIAGAWTGQSQAREPHVQGQVLVGYKGSSTGSRLVSIPKGQSPRAAAQQIANQPGVSYAVPNLIARATGSWSPNDPGTGKTLGGWSATQWNFNMVGATGAWFNLQSLGKPGGKGIKVAVLDSGVAYRDWGQFKRSPDFNTTLFSDPWDFVANNAYPLDRNGHGTFSTGVIAESTNNGIGMSGLAWGATIMPIRVLDQNGNGSALAIERGIRWAADHGAKVANLSLTFDLGVKTSQIPGIIQAIDYATNKGTLVIAAAGNDGTGKVAYPAAYYRTLSVGSVGERGCLADYSNWGANLDIVAPGGGDDAAIPGDPRCKTQIWGKGITQVGIKKGASGTALVPYQFILDQEIGTSFAAPHVAAAAALLIASGKLGANPSPGNIASRLFSTAKPTPPIMQAGKDRSRDYYGAGILDVAKATS